MTDESMIAMSKVIYKELEERNCKPGLHVLDNQCSKAVKSYIKKEKVTTQLINHYNHHVNTAKPDTNTAKDNTIAALPTMYSNCQLQVWDKFVSPNSRHAKYVACVITQSIHQPSQPSCQCGRASHQHNKVPHDSSVSYHG